MVVGYFHAIDSLSDSGEVFKPQTFFGPFDHFKFKVTVGVANRCY